MINNLFYLTFLLLPAYLLRFPIGTIGSINFLDLLLFLGVIFGSYKLSLILSWRETRNFLSNNKFFFVCISIITVSFVLSFLFNIKDSSWPSSLGTLKSFLIFPILFGTITAVLLKKNILSFNRIQWVLFLGISFQAVLGYLFVVSNRLTYDDRLSFVYESPNFFAPLLVVGILLGINLLRNVFKKNKFLIQYPSLFKTTLALLLVANVFSLVKTESLGAWVGFCVALFVYFFSQKNPQGTVKIASFLLFLSFLFLTSILSLNIFLDITQYSPSIPATSFDSRIAVYLASKTILFDHIVFGIGSGNFQAFYLNYQQLFPPYPQWAMPHAHNAFLHLWIEGGFAAAISLFALKIKVFTSMKTKTASPLVAISLAILIYFVIHGNVDVPFWKNDLAVIFWFFLSYLSLETTSWSRG